MNTKRIIYLFTIIFIAGCNTNPATQGYYPFTVDKLSETMYSIEFRGTPLSSEFEAKEQWNYKAEGVCQGSYKYSPADDTNNLCSSVNYIDCIKITTLKNDADKSYPVINGIAHCENDTSPKIIYSSLTELDSSQELKEIIIIKQLADENYFIEYAGTPSHSIDEARKSWHSHALTTCGNQDYEYNLSKNSMWQQDIKATGEGIDLRIKTKGGGGSGAIGAACATGGAIGCMLASILFTESSQPTTTVEVDDTNAVYDKTEVRFPVVEGKLICN